jgi:hypothetical protein
LITEAVFDSVCDNESVPHASDLLAGLVFAAHLERPSPIDDKIN